MKMPIVAGILWNVDALLSASAAGRLAARYQRLDPLFSAYVVPQALEQKYRIPAAVIGAALAAYYESLPD